MLHCRINLYPDQNQGEMIFANGKYKFIGEIVEGKAVRGAVFELKSPQEKLLIWNGNYMESGIEMYLTPSKLEEKIFRKLKGIKFKGLPNIDPLKDEFTFTNSDIENICGADFNFEGEIYFPTVKLSAQINGKMKVQGNNVEIKDSEIVKISPKLKMNKEDVQTAIARKFKKGIKELSFNNNQHFIRVDPDGDCSFTIQDEFHGVGKYRIEGTVKLERSDEYGNMMSTIYNIKGTVKVEEENAEPQITFPECLGVSKAYLNSN